MPVVPMFCFGSAGLALPRKAVLICTPAWRVASFSWKGPSPEDLLEKAVSSILSAWVGSLMVALWAVIQEGGSGPSWATRKSVGAGGSAHSGCFVGCLDRCLDCCLDSCLVGCPEGCPNGCLVGCLEGYPEGCPYGF
jgi:hypothetical protein